MTRARDTSQTQDNGGGAVAPYVAGKNFLINGGMEIAQRGVGPFTVNAALTYVIDRWFLYNATSSTPTAQRVAGTNTGTQYAIRLTGATSFTYGNFGQRIESNQIAPLAGKTVTVSGKIYGSATVTGFNFYAIYPTAVDNYASTTSITSGTAITVNTTLNTFSVTFALPSGVTNGLEIGINLGGGIANGVTVDISSMMLEQGAVATSFSRAGGNIQGELAACQRYFYSDSSYNYGMSCRQSTTTQSYGSFRIPTTLRTSAPTITITNQTGATIFSGATSTATTTITSNNVTYGMVGFSITHSAVGGAGYASDLSYGTATISLSAEL